MLFNVVVHFENATFLTTDRSNGPQVLGHIRIKYDVRKLGRRSIARFHAFQHLCDTREVTKVVAVDCCQMKSGAAGTGLNGAQIRLARADARFDRKFCQRRVSQIAVAAQLPHP